MTSPTLYGATWQWYISIFNGFNHSSSDIGEFVLCVANPVLISIQSAAIQIENISFSWSVTWNDNCGEYMFVEFDLYDSTGTSQLFSSGAMDYETTSYFLTASDLLALGVTTTINYTVIVTATKGAQISQANTTFEYCLLVAEDVALNTARTIVKLLQILIIQKRHSIMARFAYRGTH